MSIPSDSPVNEVCSPDSAWTTTNVGEALPGLLRPLSWTGVRGPLERGLRQGIYDLGGLTRAELAIPDRVDDRLIGVFYGRCAASIDPLRRVSDRIPGTSGDAFERQIFGRVRPGVSSRPEYRRYPVALAKSLWGATQLGRRLRQLAPEMHHWWSALCIADARTESARTLFVEAQGRLEAAFRPHMAVRMIAGGLFEQLDGLGARPGLVGSAVGAAGGGARLEEASLLVQLGEVATGSCSLDLFIRTYGFHGPAEGDLASRSWREGPAPVVSLVDAFRARDASDVIATQLNDRHHDRVSAQVELLAHVPPAQRLVVRQLLSAAWHFTVLGELGKACFLRALDGMRFAARRQGRRLTDEGVLEDPESIFWLTEAEAFSDIPSTQRAAELCAARRAQHEDFSTLLAPTSWTGPLPRVVRDPHPPEGGCTSEVMGVGVSAGTVIGTARLVLDPSTAEVEDGEILVAEFTDPSWTPLIYLAAGLVIDIGGAMSHGAVIARELGVPCVIGTGDGSRRIQTGELIEVDGRSGTVRRLGGPAA